MTAAIIRVHELASDALRQRIIAGLIANCSGKAQDWQRDATRRIQALIGREGAADVYQDSQGEWRAVIDNTNGYWDHVISADLAAKALARVAA